MNINKGGTMVKFTNVEDIKTDEDLNAFGWKMRLMQIDLNIFALQKERKTVLASYESAEETRKQQSL